MARRCYALASDRLPVIQATDWGTPVDMHGVRVSLHPAGHILGSVQVRVEHRGEVWVACGVRRRDLNSATRSTFMRD